MAGFAVLLGAFILPAAAAAQRSVRILRQGMRGPAVRDLQRELTETGFVVHRSGIFDSATVRVVRSFERRYHLATGGTGLTGLPAPTAPTTAPTTGTTTTGAPGTTTQIGVETHAPNLPNRLYGSRVLHRGMVGTDVEDLQNYLTLAGYRTAVDGAFGPLTRRSVLRFQHASHVRANGVVPRGEEMRLEHDVATAVTTSASAGQATLNADGTATAPSDAPAAVQEAIAAANAIIDDPYIYGGGHASFTDSGYDCSGSVSFALHGANLLSAPEDSTGLESYGQSGPGKWITVYADASHAFVVIAGLAFDTAHYGPTFPSGTGPRWLQPADVTANLTDGGGYIVRHPVGL
jgi:peptidoglycan hydrolase-like protein with peptidoglycan-binding domain